MFAFVYNGFIMGKKSKGKDLKTVKDKNSVDLLSMFILVPTIFIVTFTIFYFLTNNYLERKSAVSLEEEAGSLQNYLSEKEIASINIKENTDTNEGIVVLGYHQIKNTYSKDSYVAKLFITSPENFEKEIKYLSEHGYTSISLDEYIDLINTKKDSMASKKVVITFDDGYASQYEKAFPILKKYNMSATFFVYSNCIDRYPVCMTSRELKEMVDSGMKLANHTVNHLNLSTLKDRDIEKEFIQNQRFLENNFGKTNVENVVAYPFGVADARIKTIVASLGYKGGVGVSVFSKDKRDAFNIERYLMGDSLEDFHSLFKD